MSRPPGAKNKPGGQKPGRKPGKFGLPTFTDAQILDYKVAILALLSGDEPMTLTAVAIELGIPPYRVHHWANNDKDFQELINLTREVAADNIEAEFRKHPNFIPKMMLLKGYRPMFRDNWKLDVRSEKLEGLLLELKEIGKQSTAAPEKTEEVKVG